MSTANVILFKICKMSQTRAAKYTSAQAVICTKITFMHAIKKGIKS